jgi:RND family efflux transporter MFP subunit
MAGCVPAGRTRTSAAAAGRDTFRHDGERTAIRIIKKPTWHRSASLACAMAICCAIGIVAIFRAPMAEAEEGGIVADVAACLVKPKQQVQLGSPVFGVLAGVFVDRAVPVKEGQLLAKLDTTVEEAQVALDQFRAANTTLVEAAQTDLQWNKRELARRQQLAGNMFSKANDIDEYITKIEQDRIAIRKAETDMSTAKLEAARSEAQLRLKFLRSPMNGVVTDIKLYPGEFIYEQTPIMTIAQVDPLYVEMIVPADRYRSVKVGTIGEVRLKTPVDATYPARVDAIDAVIDAASDTFRVRLVLPNPDNAIPAGIRCSVRLLDPGAGE